MLRRRHLLAVGALSSSLLTATTFAPAHAATATSTMLVSATVLSFCTITALPLLFENYVSILSVASTSLTIVCTSGTTYNVGLDVGQGTGATVASRKMTFLGNTLSYGLFSDAAHSTVWGPTIGTNTVAGTASGLAQILTVYGQIAAGQTSAPGAYVDSVTATITY